MRGAQLLEALHQANLKRFRLSTPQVQLCRQRLARKNVKPAASPSPKAKRQKPADSKPERPRDKYLG